MKENKLYPLFKFLVIIFFTGIVAFVSIQAIVWGHEKYQNYRNPIEPGREMFLVIHEENPFEKHDTLFVKILEVKRGYVRYEQTVGKWKDTTSSHIGHLRHFTPRRK